MSTEKERTFPTEIDALSSWAEEGEFDPAQFTGRALHGEEAAATGRAMLAAADVDVDKVDRAWPPPHLRTRGRHG